MSRFIYFILDWSEVWALLIPLITFLIYRQQPTFFKPVVIYVIVALLLNTFQDIIAVFRVRYHFPAWLQTNNYVYNIHSIVRFICFSIFFTRVNPSSFVKLNRILSIVSLVIILINFIFFENFFRRDSFSSLLFTLESGLLLFYCLQYYLYKLQDEETNWKKKPDFWLVTGLSIYVVFNFFYFLFYTTLLEKGYVNFVMYMWNFHNISYIILCIFIARAFYVSGNK